MQLEIRYTDSYLPETWYVWEQVGHGYDAAGEHTETGICHGRFFSLEEAQAAFPDASLAKTADTEMGLIPMTSMLEVVQKLTPQLNKILENTDIPNKIEWVYGDGSNAEDIVLSVSFYLPEYTSQGYWQAVITGQDAVMLNLDHNEVQKAIQDHFEDDRILVSDYWQERPGGDCFTAKISYAVTT